MNAVKIVDPFQNVAAIALHAKVGAQIVKAVRGGAIRVSQREGAPANMATYNFKADILCPLEFKFWSDRSTKPLGVCYI
jgi:hypothetical protein